MPSNSTTPIVVRPTLEEFEGPRYQRIGHIKKLLAEGILDAELRHSQPQRRGEAGSMAAFAVSA